MRQSQKEFLNYIKKNIPIYKRIRNMSSDYRDVMDDCLMEIPRNFRLGILQIHCGGDRYIENYEESLPSFYMIKDNENKECLIHWVPIIENDFVLDLNHSKEISLIDDFCFPKDSYIDKIRSINSVSLYFIERNYKCSDMAVYDYLIQRG